MSNTNSISTNAGNLAKISVGQLVTERPARAAVFEQYGIDYCCGGKRTLEEACRQKGIALDEIAAKLIDAPVAAVGEDWAHAPLKELVEHIIAAYHQPLREQLPRILVLSEKVARVHGDHHPEMVDVFNIFRAFKEELDLHMQKEELILFPAIVAIADGGSPKMFGCGGGIEHPIAAMTLEHDSAGEALARMSTLTNNFTPPADACNSFRVLLFELAKLNSEMHAHVHKENSILFPRALALIETTSTAR